MSPYARDHLFLSIQPTILAAMVPHGLSLHSHLILYAVAPGLHVLQELANLISPCLPGLDPSYLTAYDTMMPFDLIDGHGGILRIVLLLTIAQEQQLAVIEAVAYRPFMVGHGLNKVVLALNFLKGEYAVGMYHCLHLMIGMSSNGRL